MLFNTFQYLIFLPIVFVIYWFCNKKNNLQNLILLIASYIFYLSWDWRFSFLLLFSTLLDYGCGLKIWESKQQHTKRIFLWISIIVGLGVLGIFKYFNFFTDSLANTLSRLGVTVHLPTLNIVLPIGISFYTFHGLSYTIDIYKEKIKPEKNIINYALFVSYFPLLVAGPIERASHLLPQLKQQRNFDLKQSVDGLRQILWGLFMKVVIADNCAKVVNQVFDNPHEQSSFSLILGAVFFSFQIYGDFAGYSNIALGTSKLFNIQLIKNFSFPYFSTNIAEFWRRWHISLTTWFRDYIYIPLGGSRGSKFQVIRNTFIIFTLSGLWHGANWTFIVWGIMNAVLFLPLILTNANRNNFKQETNSLSKRTFLNLIKIVFTFLLTTAAWIVFRAESIKDAWGYYKGIFENKFIDHMSFSYERILIATLIAIFVVIEWYNRDAEYGIQRIRFITIKRVKLFLYYTLLIVIFLFAADKQEFIYFQF